MPVSPALIGAALSYRILERALSAAEGEESQVKKAVGAAKKEWVSLAFYLGGALMAFVSPYVSVACYVIVAIIWIVPDRRFERQH